MIDVMAIIFINGRGIDSPQSKVASLLLHDIWTTHQDKFPKLRLGSAPAVFPTKTLEKDKALVLVTNEKNNDKIIFEFDLVNYRLIESSLVKAEDNR